MTNTRDELADELNQAFNRFLHAPEGGQSRGNAKALLERIMWDNVAGIIAHLRAHPPAQQPEGEAVALIDERLVDLRKVNDAFRGMNWDKSNETHRNDREIRWLIDLRTILRVATPPAQQPEGEAVAWRCKDYGDGWIIYQDKPEALRYQRATDCLLQPLYATKPAQDR